LWYVFQSFGIGSGVPVGLDVGLETGVGDTATFAPATSALGVVVADTLGLGTRDESEHNEKQNYDAFRFSVTLKHNGKKQVRQYEG